MKENKVFYTLENALNQVAGGLVVTFQFYSGTIRNRCFSYLCKKLAGRPVSITQSKLGVATVRRCGIGTGVGGSTSFESKKERNSLRAAPSSVKRFLLLLDEEMKHFTFSGINLLALSHDISAENFSFFGLLTTHSSKMVYSGIIRDSRPTTAFKPDCWRSQAYSFDSRYLVRLVRTLLLIVNFNAIKRDIGTKQGDFADYTKPLIEFI